MQEVEFPVVITPDNGRAIAEFIHRVIGYGVGMKISTMSTIEEKAELGITHLEPGIIVEKNDSLTFATTDLSEWTFEPGVKIEYTPTPPTFLFSLNTPPFYPQVEFSAIN